MTTGSFSLTNGAGYVTGRGERFDQLLTSAADAITIGSITEYERQEHSGTTEHYVGLASISRRGLANPGRAALARIAPQLQARAEAAGKALRFSIAGAVNNEMANLARTLSAFGEVEVNLGVPQVWDASRVLKDPIGYNLKCVRPMLRYLDEAAPKGYAVKIPPILSPTLLHDLMGAISRSNAHTIVACDGLPNAILADGGRPVLPGLFGTLGGAPLAPLALGMVRACVEYLARLDSSISVIGAGGIVDADGARAMRAVGASGVQVRSALVVLGPQVLTDISDAIASDMAAEEAAAASSVAA